MINWNVLKCIIYEMPSSHAYKINHRRRYPTGEGRGKRWWMSWQKQHKNSSSINYYSFQCYPRVSVIISQEFLDSNDPFAYMRRDEKRWRNWSKKKSKVISQKRVFIDRNLSMISFFPSFELYSFKRMRRMRMMTIMKKFGNNVLSHSLSFGCV